MGTWTLYNKSHNRQSLPRTPHSKRVFEGSRSPSPAVGSDTATTTNQSVKATNQPAVQEIILLLRIDVHRVAPRRHPPIPATVTLKRAEFGGRRTGRALCVCAMKLLSLYGSAVEWCGRSTTVFSFN